MTSKGRGSSSDAYIAASGDRTVHGSFSGGVIVRYDRAGKWYFEHDDGRRVLASVHHAAQVAAAHGFTPGLPGGKTFDRLVREARHARIDTR